MECLLLHLTELPSWKSALRKTCNKNGLKQAFVNAFTPLKLEHFYYRLLKR